MKTRFTLFALSILLWFNSCVMDNEQGGSLILDSITEVRLTSADTLFLRKEGSHTLRYALRYFSSQGEVFLQNSVKPKLLLDGVEVNNAVIDLDQETGYILQAEFPNTNKVLSNPLEINILSLESAITEINLGLRNDTNVIIPELEDFTFEDVFTIEIVLLTGERLDVNKQFLDFELLLNGLTSEKFNPQGFELGELEVQLSLNDITSNLIELNVLDIKGAISEIELKVVGESKTIIPELEELTFDDLFSIDIELITGDKLNVNKDKFEFELLLNGEISETFNLKDFEVGQSLEIQLAINNVTSNLVKLDLISVKDAISEIELTVRESLSQINKREKNGKLLDFLELKATLINSFQIDLKDFPDIFELALNGNKTDNIDINEVPDGKFEIKVSVGAVSSNSVDLEIFDPFTYIKRIDLKMDERTRNFFAVAGSSIKDFTYEIIGQNDELLSLPLTLVVDEEKQTSFQEIPIKRAGVVEAYAEISGKKSNTIKIISRADGPKEIIRVPIIFHVLDNLNKEIDRSIIDFEMEKLNLAFANKVNPSFGRSSNAVNIYMEFYLVEMDDFGNPLAEKGINMLESRGLIFEKGMAERLFLFQKMWDPRRFVNVFVGRTDLVNGYAYYPVVANASIPGITTVPSSYLIDYPYVTLIADNAMGNPIGLTLAHEIGHMLALYHPHDNNYDGFQCVDGDFCPDTESHLINATSISVSSILLNCESETFFTVNIMDYVRNRSSFTFDQRERMRKAALFNPYFAKDASHKDSRLMPFERGKLDHSIKPVACPNDRHFGRKYHQH